MTPHRLQPLLLLLLLPAAALGLEFIWQITDVHVDDRYSPSGSVDSFCHEDAGQQEQWFGRRGCALPWRTVQLAVDHMKSAVRSPAAILWTGDTAPYWPYPDWSHVFPKLRRVSSMLQTAFPDAQIVPSIGNHDAFPSDQLPGENSTFYSEYLERSGWSELLPESARRTFRRGGYYSLVAAGMRFIVLNTAMYYPVNRLTRNSGSDPAGQLAWLQEQLEGSPREVTIVSGHISPGFPHWSTTSTGLRGEQNFRLLEILSKYGIDARVFNAFGHEHIDTFKNVYRRDITFEQHTSALNTYFIAPALLPFTKDRSLNPGVRLYTVAGAILNDLIQFHFNIDTANTAHRANADVDASNYWNITYRMRDVYGLSDLTTSSMHILFKNLRSSRLEFDKYWRFAGGLYHPVAKCNDTCRKEHLCTMGAVVYDDMDQCMTAGATQTPSLWLGVTLILLVVVARLWG